MNIVGDGQEAVAGIKDVGFVFQIVVGSELRLVDRDRDGLGGTGGVVGALAVADIVVISLIATDKIKIAEKAPKKEEETGSEF